MDDTTEVMRQQIVETRSELSEKLVSLEQQVSDTVQTTGTAVNATVGAVQDTVQTVTGAVESALQSVSDALNVRQHIKQHPWLVLGGSVVLGYLAVDFLEQTAKASGRRSAPTMPPNPSDENAGQLSGQSPVACVAMPIANSTANEAASANFLWHQLTTAATGALIGIAQDAATHVVPQIMGYLNRKNVPTDSVAKEMPAVAKRQRNTTSISESFEACRTNGR